MTDLVDPELLFRTKLVSKAVENLQTLTPQHRIAVAMNIYIKVCRSAGMSIEQASYALRNGWDVTTDEFMKKEP